MFRFKIISNHYNDLSSFGAHEDVDFYLEEDSWNDYWYYTMYHLHSAGPLTNGDVEYLGPIRIMRVGQQIDEKYVLRERVKNGIFTELPDDFVSLSFAIDLYRSLSAMLPKQEQRLEFMVAMNMIMEASGELYDRVKDDKCFNTSLLRDTTIKAYPLVMARSIMFSEHTLYDLLKQAISIHFKDCDKAIDIRFDHSSGKDDSKLLPSRMVAFIGENGCGKSSILYRIARILYASPDQRKRDKTLLELKPNNIGFSKLLIVSYSSFDNFLLPGLNVSDFRLILDKLNKADGRVYLCGLRDLKSEYELLINEGEGAVEKYMMGERTTNVQLKSPQALVHEFVYALGLIFSDPDRAALWYKFNVAVNRFGFEDFPDFSLDEVYDNVDLSAFDRYGERFSCMSTGWKFVLHSVANIVARIANHTLLLFDEPENHLHPPLLSFYLTQVRKLLHKYDSGMLISTHSPVVLQELYRENVYVIHRHGDMKSVSQPQIQTFGAGFGEINADVFFLNTDITNSYKLVDNAMDEIRMPQEVKPAIVIKRIEKHLGIELSSALKAYVISKVMSEA